MTLPTSSPHTRCHFLRGVGVSIALPWLETLARAAAPAPVQRFVCVANPYGMIRDAFFPTEEGIKARLPVNLQPFEGLRGKFTVFSNLDHGFNNGHSGTHMFLSGVKVSEALSLPDGNISLDQFLARSGRANALPRAKHRRWWRGRWRRGAVLDTHGG